MIFAKGGIFTYSLQTSPTRKSFGIGGLTTGINSQKLLGAYNKSCSVSRKGRPPWGSKELNELRRKARTASNQYYISKDWRTNKNAQREYKRAVRIAEMTIWRSYCESPDSVKEPQEIPQTILDHINPGPWTESPKQSPVSLMDAQFSDIFIS